MTVTHIVAFRFKDSVTKEERVQVHTDFLHLKSACKKGDGKTFIEELVGGTSNDSTEGAGKDFDVRFPDPALLPRSDTYPCSPISTRTSSPLPTAQIVTGTSTRMLPTEHLL